MEKEVLKVKDALNTLITPGNGIQVALDYLIGSANELKGELSAIKGQYDAINTRAKLALARGQSSPASDPFPPLPQVTPTQDVLATPCPIRSQTRGTPATQNREGSTTSDKSNLSHISNRLYSVPPGPLTELPANVEPTPGFNDMDGLEGPSTAMQQGDNLEEQ